MSKPYRRFEILLPLQLIDGRPVPPELVADTLLELRQRFGAVSCETQTIRGQWQHRRSGGYDSPRGRSGADSLARRRPEAVGATRRRTG